MNHMTPIVENFSLFSYQYDKLFVENYQTYAENIKKTEDSALIKKKYRLVFNPDDKLADVYRAINANRVADALEYEHFARFIKDQYGIDLESIWNDQLTLGQIFELILSRPAST